MSEDDTRISEIIAAERSRLRAFIRRRVPDASDVEDILQESSTGSSKLTGC